MVLGFMADKDVEAMLKMMPNDATYYFTQAQTSRSMAVKTLKKLADQEDLRGECYQNVGEALEAARKAARPKDMIYVGGSMYVLAELFTALGYGDAQE